MLQEEYFFHIYFIRMLLKKKKLFKIFKSEPFFLGHFAHVSWSWSIRRAHHHHDPIHKSTPRQRCEYGNFFKNVFLVVSAQCSFLLHNILIFKAHKIPDTIRKRIEPRRIAGNKRQQRASEDFSFFFCRLRFPFEWLGEDLNKNKMNFRCEWASEMFACWMRSAFS